MKKELTCTHGVGHSGDIHGCDGCCSIIAKATENRIIGLLKDEAKRHKEEGLYTAYVYIKDVIKMIEESNNGAK